MEPQIHIGENEYDYMGRRFRKTVKDDYSGGTYTTINVTTFVWDGMNIIAEMCDAGYTNYYTFGLDMSGTLQGAGGVGGLLAMTRDTGAETNTYLYCFDGNGNVVNLVDAGDGSIAATYEYSPFCSLIRSTGDMADDNPVRWSTRHTDDETGLVMYEFRPYSPELGRFPSRDPLEELGGVNHYVFVDNSPIDLVDPFGLKPIINSSSKFTNKKDERKKECDVSSSPNWFALSDTVGDTIGAPWSASIGGVSITFTHTCVCRCLILSAKINDYYDFDPKWLKTHRSREAELKTILVRLAQVGSGCGWKEFYHKGETFDSCGSGCKAPYTP